MASCHPHAFRAQVVEALRPWFDDHLACDADLARGWAGGDVDLDRPLPSDLITAAAAADPSLMAVIGPYLAMRALPETLRIIEPRVREIYAGGWRSPVPDGPTCAELVGLVGAQAA